MPVWLLVVLYVAPGWTRRDRAWSQGGIGYLGHLGGALFGALYYQTGIRFGESLHAKAAIAAARQPAAARDSAAAAGRHRHARTGRRRGRESSRDPARARTILEAKVDAVLAKVSKLGQESLTPEEREILFKASELYKKRRK